MKKFIYLLSSLFLLFGTCAYAQHKPLKPIVLNSVYISQSGAEKSYNLGNTREIYASYFYLGKNRVSHHKGIQSPDLGYNLWEITTQIDTDEAIALELYTVKKEQFSDFYSGITQLSIVVGESTYKIANWYYSENLGRQAIMIDIDKNIANHISISGLQGICCNGIEIIAFSEIEQELWRRTAKDVYDTCKDK